VASRKSRVLVLGDWDADGVVATALLTYAQEYLKTYPLEEEVKVDKMPIDPDKLKYIISSISEEYSVVVILDIPYSEVLGNVVRILKTHFGISRAVFIDHHIASVQKHSEISRVIDEVIVDFKKPTSVLLYEELSKHGLKIHAKLTSFVEVVKYMDSGRKVPGKLMKLFEIAKAFSKVLTATRSEELWVKIVEWLANPEPLPLPLDDATWSRAREIIESRDREVGEVARDLAVTAVKIGDLRFIDARTRWKKRGATALASRLSSILKAPVAVLVNTNRGYPLLILKAPGGRAYRVAKYLLAEGIALDIAGHPNLAIVRISSNIDKSKLVEALHTALYYSS
jgi:single-stranded DNA-specific DHH superfamily exonuclease